MPSRTELRRYAFLVSGLDKPDKLVRGKPEKMGIAPRRSAGTRRGYHAIGPKVDFLPAVCPESDLRPFRDEQLMNVIKIIGTTVSTGH
jgi:hypothetical protein